MPPDSFSAEVPSKPRTQDQPSRHAPCGNETRELSRFDTRFVAHGVGGQPNIPELSSFYGAYVLLIKPV
jgi:hypothetical protein